MSLHFDFIDLRLVTYIAEEQSMTRAASRVFLSLPAASLRIKNLEQSIGTTLFDRSAQGIRLRPAGEAFLHHARQVLGQVELLRADLQEYTQGIKGHVRIQANTTAITEYLPQVLSQYLSQWADVNIDLKERSSTDIVRAVSNGMTDIGIVAGSVNTDGLHTLPYHQDSLVLVVSRQHPLAKQSRVSFESCLDYNYIVLDESTAIHSFLGQVTRALNQPLRIRIQVGNFEAACRMVAANVGVSVLPESSARRHAKNLPIHLVQLDNDWALRHLTICMRAKDGLPHYTQELIALLQEDAQRPLLDV